MKEFTQGIHHGNAEGTEVARTPRVDRGAIAIEGGKNHMLNSESPYHQALGGDCADPAVRAASVSSVFPW